MKHIYKYKMYVRAFPILQFCHVVQVISLQEGMYALITASS